MSDTGTMIAVLQRYLTQQGKGQTGIFPTPVPRLSIACSASITEPVQVVHQPALCLVLQGAKKVMLDDEIIEYGADHYLLVSVDLPLSGQVIEASEHAPYLCLRLDLDTELLSELLLQLPENKSSDKVIKGLAVSKVTENLRDATNRLVNLLDSSQDIAVLAPLFEREIMYWLLRGEQAALLRQIVSAETRMNQIHKTIQYLKATYREPFDKQALIDISCMSATTFFQHFKAVTRMTPLQYQKQLRLQEARRLLLLNEMDVANVGYDVGYESPSQFTREYSRQFGEPPSKDGRLLRQSGKFVSALL